MKKQSILIAAAAIMGLAACGNKPMPSSSQSSLAPTSSEVSISEESSIISSESSSSDPTKQIEMKVNDFSTANGAFDQSESNIVSGGVNSLSVHNKETLSKQHIDVTLTLSGTASDSGFVFGLSSTSSSFWEGAGVSYYFFFISQAGTAYLGKTDNGTWTECWIGNISGYKVDGTFTLGADFNGSKIFLYVNGKNIGSYYDEEPLAGTKWGLRSGVAGTIYSQVTIGALQKTGEEDIKGYQVIDGMFVNGGIGPKSAGVNNIAIVKGAEFESGTYTGTVSVTETSGKGGIVFGLKDKDNYYRLTASNMSRRITLEKVKGGVVTELSSSFMGASYTSTSSKELTVIIKDGVSTCKFNELQYFSFPVTLFGKGYGVYSEKANMISISKVVGTSTETTQADVLLYGHSYMQLWQTFDSDLRTLNRFADKKISNMGIGGSVASQWEKLVTGAISYGAKTGIFDIGINDLTGGVSPSLIIDSVEKIITSIKAAIPDYTVVLLSTSRCNARDTADYRSSIHALNEKFKALTFKYSAWVKYAEVELAFCDASGNPIASKFKDKLHPTNAAYLEQYVPAIDRALNNQDQPTEPGKEETLEEAKAIKKCQMYPYSEGAYRNDEWTASAKTIYDQAIAAIDNCTTIEAVKALDLSSYVGELSKIKGESAYFYDEVYKSKERNADSEFNAKFRKDGTGIYKMAGYGYALNDAMTFDGDYSFTVKAEHIKGKVATGGIFFNANMNAAYKYICGYLLNFVEGMDYLQLYYVEGHYGTGSDIPQVLEYIGGYVCDKNVMGLNFRVNVKDSESRIYVYENEQYLKFGEEAYCASAPMIYGGKKYSGGRLGVMAWNAATHFTLAIDNIVK